MPEFNIDQYKKTWQESSAATQYSKDEIVQMLNKKSTNYIKYILWIYVQAAPFSENRTAAVHYN